MKIGQNIALFGVDSEDGNGRSDSIIIATISPINDALSLATKIITMGGHKLE